MLRYLLDTSVVSEPLRPKPRHGVLRKLQRHEEEIAISSIVWHELRYGTERLPPSRKRAVIEQYLHDVVVTTMPIIDYDRRAAEWHARERARLAAKGVVPPFGDGQIAAVAAVNDLVLVTFNAGDFKSFEKVQIVSWA